MLDDNQPEHSSRRGVLGKSITKVTKRGSRTGQK